MLVLAVVLESAPTFRHCIVYNQTTEKACNTLSYDICYATLFTRLLVAPVVFVWSPIYSDNFWSCFIPVYCCRASLHYTHLRTNIASLPRAVKWVRTDLKRFLTSWNFACSCVTTRRSSRLVMKWLVAWWCPLCRSLLLHPRGSLCATSDPEITCKLSHIFKWKLIRNKKHCIRTVFSLPNRRHDDVTLITESTLCDVPLLY